MAEDAEKDRLVIEEAETTRGRMHADTEAHSRSRNLGTFIHARNKVSDPTSRMFERARPRQAESSQHSDGCELVELLRLTCERKVPAMGHRCCQDSD